ncbi:MAG: response regulator [Gemmatimonadaceae bacterium]
MVTPDSSEFGRRAEDCVLIADDHEHSRSAARLVLEDSGFTVIEARTGYDALVLARIRRPCVMLLDIVLPEIDGIELTRMMRADPVLRYSAIIAFTACSGSDYREAALAAGCDEFVTKPVAAPHLVELVRLCARRVAPSANDHELLGAAGAIAVPPYVVPVPVGTVSVP